MKRVFLFRKAVLKPWWCVCKWEPRERKDEALLRTGWALAALREATKEKLITRVMWLGREVRAEKDKQTQSSTQRKSTSRRGRYSRSGFSAT